VREFLVVVLLLAACAAGACKLSAQGPQRDKSGTAMKRGAGAPEVARREARLAEKGVDESSGVVASRRAPGLFWTHNDSGDGPFLYAFDAEGHRRGVWRVTGARAVDWEDIAAGPGPEPGRPYLYVGDIGDNGRERPYVSVYRFPEPEPAAGGADDDSRRKRPHETGPAEEIRLKYPEGPQNAETLLVHTSTGDIYIVVKNNEAACAVYRLRAAEVKAGVNTLERAGEFRSPSPLGSIVTGGDIAPDGRRLVLCDYLSAYELRLPDAAGAAFDQIWQQTPAVIQLGPRRQGEAVCYRLDGAALLATSEGSPAMLYEIELPK